MSISLFKGTAYVAVREFYIKDGKVGVRFLLCELSGGGGAGGGRGSTTGSLCALACARAQQLLHAHRTHTQELPGKKGLNMTVDAWKLLVAGMPVINGALAQRQ